MKFTGIVTKVGETITGTSAKGEWSKTQVVIAELEPGEDEVVLDIWGSELLEKLKVGEVVNVEWLQKSREWNGKIFENRSNYKVTVIGETKAPQTDTEKPTDDLPF
jgi:uncharacterized OB-fold protein